MFFDITSHPAVGSKAKGTLVFEKAGTIEIEYKVEAATTKSSGHEHGGKSSAPSGKGSVRVRFWLGSGWSWQPVDLCCGSGPRPGLRWRWC